MESVEEICNHIALINRAETVLQGPINKIKNDFRNNTFSVKIKADKLLLPTDFEILHQQENHYQIQLKENTTTNDLLNELIKNGQIISFEEQTPSMEDIFIKAVKNE